MFNSKLAASGKFNFRPEEQSFPHSALKSTHNEISGQFHRKHCISLPQASSKCLEHKNAGRSFKYGLMPKLTVSKSVELIGPVITRACV